ncbi:MAG: TIGR02253 family HAD-type hydrolase [Planctomycetota bacterium]
MSLLKAIFFDIDDTLYSTTEFAEIARERAVDAMAKMGMRMKPANLKAELDEVVSEFSSNYEYHFDKLLQRVPRRYYKGINPSLLIAGAVVAYHDTKFRELRPYEDVVEVIRILDNTDIVLGIISAGITIKQIEKLIRTGLLEYISPNAIFISDQIGISKPNVKLYQRACSDLNLRPGETMYVGDNPANDIDPPNNIGMITVWNKRGGKHITRASRSKPNYEIHNFWDLLDILREDFQLEV